MPSLHAELWPAAPIPRPDPALLASSPSLLLPAPQVWQWVRYGAKLDTGKTVTEELVRKVVDEELQAARAALGDEK